MTDDGYRLRVLQRCTVAGSRFLVGQVLVVPAGRLRVAAWLCGNGSARPADKSTATDVALFEALRLALPQ